MAEVQLLNAYVIVYARVILNPDAERVMDRFRQVALHIEDSGMVSFGRGVIRDESDRKQHQRDREVVDMLIEEELLEWRRIGPEDSELFLTNRGREHFAPQMAVLGGWHELPEEQEVEA